MPIGYRITPGTNPNIWFGDTASNTAVTFSSEFRIGSGSLNVTGTIDGQPVSNLQIGGTYYGVTTGASPNTTVTVYFVPDADPANMTLTSASVDISPVYSTSLRFGFENFNDWITSDNTVAHSYYTGSGNDYVVAGVDGNSPADTDYVNLGPGSDTAYGGSGWDRFDGGAGNDYLVGEHGTDIIDYSWATGPINFTVRGGRFTFSAPGMGTDTLEGIDGVMGTAYDDTLTGTNGDGADGPNGTDVYTNYIDGGAGNDYIDGLTGSDVLFGGSGADTIIGGLWDGNRGFVFTSGGTVLGGTVDDRIYGGLGDDVIYGDDTAGISTLGGNDYIDGGSGDDRIVAGAGNDTVLGGEGSDTIIGGAGADSIFGQAGNDVIYGDDTLGTSTIGGNDYIDGGSGADSIIAGVGDDTVLGGRGADTIFGGSGNDLIYGGTTNLGDTLDGADYIDAGSGADTVYAGHGADTVYGGGENDLIYGGAGNDVLFGGTGSDTLYGEGGNDSLDGGEGADYLFGGAGQDTIMVGLGDRADGGTGSDLFRVDLLQAGEGPIDVTGGEDADGSDWDTLDASSIPFDTTVTWDGAESGTATAGGGVLNFREIERVVTGSGADTLDASGAGAAPVDVATGAGADRITGSAGADTIDAGTGADTVEGGAGDDRIELGGGAAGDGSADLLILGNDFGADTVTGFEGPVYNSATDSYSSTDHVDVSGLNNASGNPVRTWDVTTVGLDTNGDGTPDSVVLQFPNGETLTLIGVTPDRVDTGAELHAMGIPCFAAGTMIETTTGPVAVETLRAGDLVLTRDNGAQPVRWVGVRRLGAGELAVAPHLRPIRIRQGALGSGLPLRDLIVSPQHRVMVRSKIAQRMFGTQEVLVAAKQLLVLDGVSVEPAQGVTYVHFLCDQHEIVISEGAATESLYTGAEAMKAVGAAAQDEIFALFPELRGGGADALPKAARVLVPGRQARQLAARHARNDQPLVM